MSQYAIVSGADRETHALNGMNEIMCGYERQEDDQVTSVWYNPALTTVITTCKLCCRKILEATDESLRLYQS